MEISDATAILTEDPSTTGIFSDFDGTLSPIVSRPEDAAPAEGVLDALAGLATRFAIVGIVTARSLEDIKMRCNPPGVLLAGAYGRERSDRPVRRATEGWETAALAASAAVSKLDGVRIERKGTGVALHFRAAPEREQDVMDIARTIASEFSLELRPGRMVADLIIPGPGKGDAIAALAAERKLATVMMAGDDIADVEAFAMLRKSDLRTVIVAVASEEAPDDLREHADVVLNRPEALAAFLKTLA